MLKDLIRILCEATGGGEQGKLEIASMSYQQALDFGEEKSFDFEKEIEGFKENFQSAQKKARVGWTKRREMLVIGTSQVRDFQNRLAKGYFDINEPFSGDTDQKNPFPQGLSGKAAQDFLEAGLRDGDEHDDKVAVNMGRVRVSSLKPIQKQMYFDNAMGNTIQRGLKNSLDHIINDTFFITSKDNYIIDGHHRFLAVLLVEPDAMVNALEIDLPIDKLLPLALAYGDAVGNKRNA